MKAVVVPPHPFYRLLRVLALGCCILGLEGVLLSNACALAEAKSLTEPETQELRDRYGRLIGRIRPIGDGRLEGRDAQGRLRGHYNPKTNETRDPQGRLVGKGNFLTNLITDSLQ